MPAVLPGSESFRTPVYGTVFGKRMTVVADLQPGDRLILVPDPPIVCNPCVWVHALGGDVVGHLSPDINAWLAPAMYAGDCYRAEVESVLGEEVASWKRLVISARCVRSASAAPPHA